MGESEI